MRTVVRRALIAICVLAALLSPGLSAQHPVAPDPAVAAPSAVPQDGVPDIFTGMAGGGGIARLFSGTDHAQLIAGAPFGGFTGGVRVAMGDVTGDGVADLMTAQGPGGGLVKVFDGLSGLEIASGHPFGPAFIGGVYVASADVDRDGHYDVIVSTGVGGWVRTYSIAGGVRLLNEGTPYGPAFTGGIRIAAGAHQDGHAVVAVAPASGPGTVQVYRFDPADGTPILLRSVTPYEADFAGGVFVAVGDVDGDGVADLITSASNAARPIRVFSGALGAFAPILSIPSGLPMGISVAAADLDGDGKAEIIGAMGPGGPPLVGVFDGTGALVSFFAVEAPPFAGGLFVAAPSSGGGIRFTSAATTTFTTGTAGSFTITTSAIPTVTGIAVSGTLPGGVTFTDNHDGTATLSGTPTPGVGGVHSLTFTATNGDDAPATQTFTLRVEGPPQITSANTTTFHVNGAGSFIVTTIGFPRPTLTATGALPPGVTFTSNDDGTATLAGTPQAGSGGTYPLTLTASNGVGAAVTQAFTLTVDASPVFTSAASTTFLAGVASSFAITASAEPAITTITQTGPLPPGVSFLDNGGGSATLSGTPPLGAGGTYTFTLTAANGVAPNAVQSFALTVQQAPAITSANATTFSINAVSTFDVISTGFPTAALSVAGALPTGVTFVDDGDGTARITGTPTVGGVYTLTITAGNGVGTDATQTFTLTVEQGAAITSVAATTFVVGTAGSFPVTSTGTPTPTVTYAGTLPGGVTVGASVNGTALLSGTPAAGMGGTYPIDFTATNGIGAPAVQNFVLTVHQAPAFTSVATATFTLGIAGTFDVQSTGFPIATLTVDGDLPDGVTFVDDTDGSGRFVGTALAGTSGNYPVTITATNGVGATPATQSFTLSVHQIPAITSAASTSFSVGQAGTFDIVATGFPTPTIAIGVTPPPSGVTFTPNGDGTATLAGTPATGTGGAHTLTFTATNAAGSSVPQTFTLNVNTPPSFTSGTSTTFTAGTAGAFAVTADGLPAPTISHTGGAFPAGVTFNPSTNTIEGTATAIGTFAGLAFTATNGVNPDATQSFTLTVICPVITVTATPPALPNGTFGVAYPNVQFSQTGGGAGTWSATGLPPGVGLDSGTGLLSGTPTNTGTFSTIVTFTNTAGCTGTFSDTFDVAPNAANDTYDAGIGNTFMIVAGHSLTLDPHVSFASSLLANDAGPTGTLTVTPVGNGITAGGGNIVIDALGRFSYKPQVGDVGTDSFVYTVTSNGVSAQGAIFLGLGTERIWYVKPSAAPGGDGSSLSPFDVMLPLNQPSGVGDVDDDGDYIYLFAGNHPGTLTIEAGQTVWGARTAFNPVPGLTIPADTAAVIEGTVTVAGDNVTISGLSISSSFSTGLTNTGTRASLTVKNGVIVTTTTGTAVVLNNVNSTAGGAPDNGINFLFVSTDGAANGIVLNGVNQTSGSFTVIGDSGPTNNGSGGTIQSTTGPAVLLTNANNVSLGYMNIINAGADGVRATSVNGLTLSRTTISDNTGDTGADNGIELINPSGAVAITNTTVSNSPHNNITVDMTGGTVSAFTLTNSTIASAVGNSGIDVALKGNATVTAFTVTGSTFQNNFADALQIDAADTSTVTATIQTNTFTGNNIGLDLVQNASGKPSYKVLNNNFQNQASTAINLFTNTVSTTDGELQARIENNTIGTDGVIDSGSKVGNAVRINMNGNARTIALVNNNQIHEVPNARTVEIVRREPGSAAAQPADVTVTGNTVTDPTGTTSIACGSPVPCPGAVFYSSADGFDLGFPTILNLNVSGNTAYNPIALFALGSEGAYRVREVAGGTTQIVGAAATATAQISGTNTTTAPAGALPVNVDAGVSLIPGPITVPDP